MMREYLTQNAESLKTIQKIVRVVVSIVPVGTKS